MKLEGGGRVTIVIYHCFIQQNVHLMLSTFCRCMGITCNIWGRAQDPTQLTHALRGDGKHATGYRALLWQSMVSDDYAGILGDYDIIYFLPRKAALFLFEYHDTDFRVTVPGLPPLPAPQARDAYLDVHGIVRNEEITELLATLKKRDAAKDRGHFRLFGTLAIGHKAHPGFQRVQCWPFKDLFYYGANRQDFVLVRPPGTAGAIFTPTPDNLWYCKVLLLFDMEAETDNGPKEYRCAYVSLLEQLKPREPDAYKDLRLCGSRVVYEHTTEVIGV
jgi:hypothetical protein